MRKTGPQSLHDALFLLDRLHAIGSTWHSKSIIRHRAPVVDANRRLRLVGVQP